MKLILMRGVSGSGKSTLAKKLAAAHEGVIYSTDDFFMLEAEKIALSATQPETCERNG